MRRVSTGKLSVWSTPRRRSRLRYDKESLSCSLRGRAFLASHRLSSPLFATRRNEGTARSPPGLERIRHFISSALFRSKVQPRGGTGELGATRHLFFSNC